MKLFSIYDDDCLILQRAEYIEDGWYITHRSGTDTWSLYEIPEGGGIVNRIGNYPNIGEALDNADQLT